MGSHETQIGSHSLVRTQTNSHPNALARLLECRESTEIYMNDGKSETKRGTWNRNVVKRVHVRYSSYFGAYKYCATTLRNEASFIFYPFYPFIHSFIHFKCKRALPHSLKLYLSSLSPFWGNPLISHNYHPLLILGPAEELFFHYSPLNSCHSVFHKFTWIHCSRIVTWTAFLWI